jgi:adenine-specific DNA-methyltransferase
LLAHHDSSYEWVNPADYRVSEVRLLHDAASYGSVGKVRAADNLLIHGDALNALTSLARLPEFASQYLGKVRLVYIDPPFNTQQSFLQYDDGLEHSVWLTMMRDRLLQIRDLLSPDGSVWVHCDDSEQGYLRVLMDEVFGRQNFVATVIWEKVYSPRMDSERFSTSHDYIVVYAAGSGFGVNGFQQTPGTSKMFTLADENGRRYRLRNLRKEGKNSARADRPNLYYAITAPDGSEVFPVKADGSEGNWRWQESTYLAHGGEVEWIQRPQGWSAYLRQYEDAARPRPPETLWTHEDCGSNHTANTEMRKLFPDMAPFATPKPEALLHRVIHIGSSPGDIVLDCFLGSGTAAAVAHKMGRRWIGVERESATVEGYATPRLKKVVDGHDSGGVTKRVHWQGGGGFRVLEVAPSMFVADDGMVFLADWMTNGKLAEATAAQLGFVYEVSPPFCGRKGRARLAVVDGIVNESVVRLLATALPERERVVICGTAIDPDSRTTLKDISPGSTLRKIPAALLEQYRSTRQLKLDLLTTETVAEEVGS